MGRLQKTNESERLRKIAPIIELLKDPENAEIVWLAVCMRQNLITTGDPVFSVDDIVRQQKAGINRKLKPLSDSQLELVNKLEVLKSVLFDSF